MKYLIISIISDSAILTSRKWTQIDYLRPDELRFEELELELDPELDLEEEEEPELEEPLLDVFELEPE